MIPIDEMVPINEMIPRIAHKYLPHSVFKSNRIETNDRNEVEQLGILNYEFTSSYTTSVFSGLRKIRYNKIKKRQAITIISIILLPLTLDHDKSFTTVVGLPRVICHYSGLPLKTDTVDGNYSVNDVNR